MNDAINRITILENVHQTSNIEIQEQLYYEVQERMRRGENVIILGVPKSTEDDFLENFLSEIVNGKEVPFELKKCRYFRIGKVNKEKSRSVKIIMDTLEHAKWLLVNQKKFTEYGIKFVNDKTPEQQKYLYNLGKQLDELKKGGEVNATIKYMKNRPIIIRPMGNDKSQKVIQSLGPNKATKTYVPQRAFPASRKLVDNNTFTIHSNTRVTYRNKPDDISSSSVSQQSTSAVTNDYQAKNYMHLP
ncbi:hypothetical protein QAD02_007761 [Eretmocerus hayati]|uniref:Uncharacterized protein n=1 Tax=Eretmocerus hayati TaxID=131215 RepID=A0ACC2N4G8_9HYME|nr:hypothetical protein QAD02_007761 [Eretmocerus hayati]